MCHRGRQTALLRSFFGAGGILLLLAAVLMTACSQTPTPPKPEPTRFTHTVVTDGLDEPLQVEFDEQGRVYWIERRGAVQRIHESTGRIENLGTLPLYDGNAPGLVGLLLDQQFAQTRRLFVYYSTAGDNGNMRLSRFTLGTDGTLDMDSEAVLLKIPWTQPDGSHTIPDGNLFSKDTPKTRPEIYVMGSRNPWRLSIDSKTGDLHWGEVGLDAGADSDDSFPRRSSWAPTCCGRTTPTPVTIQSTAFRSVRLVL